MHTCQHGLAAAYTNRIPSRKRFSLIWHDAVLAAKPVPKIYLRSVSANLVNHDADEHDRGAETYDGDAESVSAHARDQTWMPCPT
jgi:hypothetical protein